MPRPPCIGQLWRDCINQVGYIEFGDGLRYKYPLGVREVVTTAGFFPHGEMFNRPGIRRRNRPPRQGALIDPPGYERVIDIPNTACRIYTNTQIPDLQPIVPCSLIPPTHWSDFGGATNTYDDGAGSTITETCVGGSGLTVNVTSTVQPGAIAGVSINGTIQTGPYPSIIAVTFPSLNHPDSVLALDVTDVFAVTPYTLSSDDGTGIPLTIIIPILRYCQQSVEFQLNSVVANGDPSTPWSPGWSWTVI